MSLPTERRRAERRHAERTSDEELSPEYLALLEVCGGEIRAGDRAVLAGKRQAAQAEAGAPLGNEKEGAARAPMLSVDRRAAKT